MILRSFSLILCWVPEELSLFFGPDCIQLWELHHQMRISATTGGLLLVSKMFPS